MPRPEYVGVLRNLGTKGVSGVERDARTRRRPRDPRGQWPTTAP